LLYGYSFLFVLFYNFFYKVIGSHPVEKNVRTCKTKGTVALVVVDEINAGSLVLARARLAFVFLLSLSQKGRHSCRVKTEEPTFDQKEIFLFKRLSVCFEIDS
jgi:hypothetical protein